jgi:isoleucyl-tRNA synthetase
MPRLRRALDRVQREEFKRLGVEGDWANPYSTMAYPAEAQIAREIMRFATTDQLFRGSKPVLWSSVERTALAEAEVEYHERTSTTVWVKFPIVDTLDGDLEGAAVVIWTTTPWTLPANRAIVFGPEIAYGLYEVTEAPADNWAKSGERYVLADKLAADVFSAARANAFRRVKDVLPVMVAGCAHPFRGVAGANGYWDFGVPVLPADYVTDDAGTGFVHTAPGHGADDYNTFVKHRDSFASAGTHEVPHTVSEDSSYFPDVPFFAGERIFDERGKDAGANEAVIRKLVEVGWLLARGRLKHAYPHSWRSKGPLIFRNTPQWFIAMDKPLATPLEGEVEGGRDQVRGTAATDPDGAAGGALGSVMWPQNEAPPQDTLRHRALAAIKTVRWVPPQGQNRITGMIEAKPTGSCRASVPGVRRSAFSCAGARTRFSRTNASTRPSPRPSSARAPTPGSRTRMAAVSLRPLVTTRRSSRRSATSWMSGSIPAAPTPLRWKCARI